MPFRIDDRSRSIRGPARGFRAAAFILIALAFCSASHVRKVSAGTTIVPGSERISDFDARLALARLLSYKKSSLKESLRHYRKLLAEQGNNSIVRLEYGQILLRHGQFTRAITEFQGLLGQHPDAVEGLGDAYLYVGRTQKAIDSYRTAFRLTPDDQTIQRKLGVALSYTNLTREALALLEPLSKKAPENKEVGIALLRLYNKTAQVEKGLNFFRNTKGRFSSDPAFLREAAYLEAKAGHAASCRDLFLKAISIKGDSADLSLEFADLMYIWGDFFKIERIYRQHLKRRPEDFSIQLKLAGLLRSSQRYEEAEGLYGILLYQGFPKAKLLMELAGLKLQEKAFLEAQSFLHRFFELPGIATDASASEADQTENDGVAEWYQDACFLNAEIFYSLKQYENAYSAYHDLLSRIPDDSVPDKIDALIGMGKSALKLSDQFRARTAFKKARDLDRDHIEAKFYGYLSDTDPDTARKACVETWIDPASESSMALTQWARLLAARGWNSQAIFCYEAALGKDPDNFPAKVELAELLGLEKHYERSTDLFNALDRQFPQTYKITLGLARVLAWSRAYEPAVNTYEALLSARPRHPVLLMELARTKSWAKKMNGALETYEKLYTPSLDQILLKQLNALSIDLTDGPLNDRLEQLRKTAGETSVYEGYEDFFQNAHGVMAKSPDPDPRLEKLRIQLLPAYRIQKTARLERKAKYEAYHMRFLAARNTLSELTAHQPGNQEAIFDRAQADCALGLCDEEAKAYRTLLDLDPLHSLARTALERNEIRNNPYVRTDYAYAREQGRGELSQIEHQRFDLQLDIPFSCRYHFRIMGHRWLESPLRNETATYELNGHTLELSGVLTPALTGMLRWTKKYDADEGFGGTDTGNAHLWLNLKDRMKIGIGADRRDVFDNDFSIRQETQVDAWWIGLTANPSRRLDLKARADYLSYSDDNEGAKGEASAGYAFTDHPKVFKTILNAEYRDTQYENIFHYQGGTLTDITHPYWTPRAYWAGGGSLEWYHDLSKQLFCGSQHHFYDIVLSLGQNSDRNPSIEVSLKWHLEFNQHWMINIEGLVHRSEDWDADVFQAAIRYQF